MKICTRQYLNHLSLEQTQKTKAQLPQRDCLQGRISSRGFSAVER